MNTKPGDWAEECAKEWLDRMIDDGPMAEASLAALLREVAQRAADEERKLGLAEVRRVVEDVQKSIWGAPTDEGSAVTLCCSEILSRLEKL